MLPVVRALAKMTLDKTDAASGVTEARRVKAIGLVDFPWPVVQTLVSAGQGRAV